MIEGLNCQAGLVVAGFKIAYPPETAQQLNHLPNYRQATEGENNIGEMPHRGKDPRGIPLMSATATHVIP